MKQWIFFLHAPQPFRALATLTFTAQQLLVPCLAYGKIHGIDPSSLKNKLLVDLPASSIASHYNMQQSSYLSSGPHYRVSEDWLCLYGNKK
jgi:hypothetical protein